MAEGGDFVYLEQEGNFEVVILLYGQIISFGRNGRSIIAFFLKRSGITEPKGRKLRRTLERESKKVRER